jgi:hypothetical protein
MSNCIIKCQPSATSKGECICYNQEASRIKSRLKEIIATDQRKSKTNKTDIKKKWTKEK